MTLTEYLSVSELTTLLEQTLEQSFSTVLIEGEITDYRPHASGHAYFTLQDPKSKVASRLPCVMWKNSVGSLSFKLENGMTVQCNGKFNIFRGNGKVQIQINRAQVAGEGLLQKKFLELKERLEREGLFDPSRKRPLPYLPKAIGVVTSKSGAVIRDIQTRLQERFSSIPVFVADAKVQGDGAAQSVKEGIELLNEQKIVDVIIVARGGGSLEDLWAFNEELVARAIFSSRIPIISAIGHETDVTLADLVADMRAPTPTAAAEMVAPERRQLVRDVKDKLRRLFVTDRWSLTRAQQIDELSGRLESYIQQRMHELQWMLASCNSRLTTIHPQRVLDARKENVAVFLTRLTRTTEHHVAIVGNKLSSLERQTAPYRLLRSLQVQKERVELVASHLKRGTHNLLSSSQRLVLSHETTLKALSPQRVLERGYTLVKQEGEIQPSSRKVDTSKEITVCWADGEITFSSQKSDALVHKS